MKVSFGSDNPITDAACRKATGRTLKEWFKALDDQSELRSKRRDAIRWMYDTAGLKDVWWPTTIWVEYERVNGVVNKKDGFAEGFNICVTKTINAPVADVYRQWADAKALCKWLGKSVKATVADGGAFDDGDGHTGEYKRVRENKDLRFTWNDANAACPTLIDVVFEDKGKGKTGLMLQHQRLQNRDEADGLRRAWSEAFDGLKSLCEAEVKPGR